MKNISKEQYEFANNRMEELLKKMTEDTPDNDPLMLELDIVSDIVEQYETEHFPIPVPTLGAIISDALRDAGMTGKELAKKLGISPSRVSDYINNKTEPSLRIASSLCSILDIKPFEIVIGDIHGRHTWKEIVVKHPEDTIVFLGDCQLPTP